MIWSIRHLHYTTFSIAKTKDMAYDENNMLCALKSSAISFIWIWSFHLLTTNCGLVQRTNLALSQLFAFFYSRELGKRFLLSLKFGMHELVEQCEKYIARLKL